MEGKSPSKVKRRNSDKRKEKSRDAARSRRTLESERFSLLANALPLPQSVIAHLDKASIMRLAIAHLRLLNIFKSLDLDKERKADIYDSLYLKAIGGFLLVVSLDGEIIFVSNNVSAYLGILQVDLLGQSIYDVSHPCDHSEIKDLLSGKMVDKGQQSFFMRMKCFLTNKGRNVHLKSATYKVLHTSGRFVQLDGGQAKDKFSFVGIASPIPHPIDIEIPLGMYTFLSKHSLDMKFTYADDRMETFLGYRPDSLLGKSMYNYHHVQDNRNIDKAFKSLFSKGQSDTGQYRFLAQGGGYVWVSTQATVIYYEKNSKPESVVCVNYIISEKCDEIGIYSSEQLEYVKKKQAAAAASAEKKPVSSTAKVIASIKPEQSARPQPATLKIFAPRTADMNTGFLTFSDDDPGSTTIKDEPDDLTHLAPNAGDVCVPLPTPTLNEALMSYSTVWLDRTEDNYYPLLNSSKEVPLFSSFKDDQSNDSHSPSLTQSPASCGVPSLCGIGDDGASLDDPALKSFLYPDLVDAEAESLSCKNAYLSTDCDDLPVLMPPFDLPWNMEFAPSSSAASSSRCSPTPSELKAEDNIQSLAQLLQTSNSSEMINHRNKNNHLLTEPERRKRVSSVDQDGIKKRKHQTYQDTDHGGGGSVLLNLLVDGCDISAGYTCINSQRPASTKENI